MQYCGSSAATDWEILISTTVEPVTVRIREFSPKTSVVLSAGQLFQCEDWSMAGKEENRT